MNCVEIIYKVEEDPKDIKLHQTELIQQPLVGMLEAAIVLGQYTGINLLRRVGDLLRTKWQRYQNVSQD